MKGISEYLEKLEQRVNPRTIAKPSRNSKFYTHSNNIKLTNEERPFSIADSEI
mgnify:CR=1 FL=1|tara:strand:+ start:382 stop:540 length:159 start_codon:yes stop_codon:yes gene_type:complete